jgi:hypothetical protein
MIAKTQPLLVAWLSTILITLAARYAPGAHLDDAQALWLAGGLVTLGTALVHRRVTPVARPRDATGTPLVPVNQKLPAKAVFDQESVVAKDRPPG